MSNLFVYQVNAISNEQNLQKPSEASDTGISDTIITTLTVVTMQDILTNIIAQGSNSETVDSGSSTSNCPDDERTGQSAAGLTSAPPPASPSASSGSLPDWFTNQIPDKYFDPSCPGSDILTKLYQMIEYMHSHPDNIDAVKVFYSFICNMRSAGLFKLHPEIVQMLDTITFNGKSLPEELVTILSQDSFFETGDANKAYNYLLSMRIDNPQDDLSKSIDAYIDKIIHSGGDWNWNDFINHNTDKTTGKPRYTPAQGNCFEGGNWGNFIMHANIAQWKTSMRHYMVNLISKKCGNNSFQELQLLIIFLFSLNDASACDEINGFGSTAKFFSDRTKDMTNIVNYWRDIDGHELDGYDLARIQDVKDLQDYWDSPLTACDSGCDFMKKLEDFKSQIDNANLPAQLKGDFDKEVAHIEDLSATDKDGKTLTWLGWYNAYNAGDTHAHDVLNNSYSSQKMTTDEGPTGYKTKIIDTLKDLSKMCREDLEPSNVGGFGFMQNLEDFRSSIDNSPLASDIKDQVDTQLDQIENTKCVDDNGNTVTWLELYHKAEAGDVPSKNLLNSSYRMLHQDDPKSPPNLDAQNIENTLKSLTASITDQSQSQTTQLTELTNNNQANDNSFNKLLTSINDLIKAAVQNQKY